MQNKADLDEDAKTIYQAWLDETAEAVLTGDVDACQSFVNLPYHYVNHETRVVIETREDLAKGVETMANAMRAFGVNQFIRLATDAEFLCADYIQGHHVTHLLRNATYMVPSFLNRVVLRRGRERWKATEYVSAVPHGYWPAENRRGEVERALPETLDTKDARRQAQDPLAVYQRFLNSMTRANVTEDFGSFEGLFSLPFSSHGARYDAIIDNREALREAFDGFTTRLKDNQIEEFLRIATHAEFLSGDTLCGYHTTYFLRDAKDALAPVPARMILQRKGTRWLLQSVTNALGNEKFNTSGPIIPGDLVTHREIQERTKEWPNLH